MTACAPSFVPPRGVAWLIFALVSIASLTNFYTYDSIGPVADLLQRQRGFTDSQIGLLGAIYSIPNVVLLLLGGRLVDRHGAGFMTVVTLAICLIGAVITAWAPTFATMVTGRLLFGIGAETSAIAATVALLPYFQRSNLAFVFGASLALGRLGSWGADMSPTWFASAYAQGWQPPLVIAALSAAAGCVFGTIYWLIDRPRHLRARIEVPQVPFRPSQLLCAGAAYWLLLVLCVLWYSAIIAFRGTFAIKYFQHAHGLDLASAGRLNGAVFFAAVFATPLFGWVCDRTGRYLPLITLGAALLPISLLVLMFTDANLWIATALIGLSYSMVPAVMWPLVARLVPERIFGTALGLMWVLQNAGIGGANLVAGALNDAASAGADNPSGYQPMMWFFFVSGLLGLAAAATIWAITRVPSSSAPVAQATAPASSP